MGVIFRFTTRAIKIKAEPLPILEKKRTSFLGYLSAILPPIGAANGLTRIGSDAIKPTMKDESVFSNTYQPTNIILKKYDDFIEKGPQEKMIKAEVWFTIHYEMACSPIDFFMRRTGRLFFDIDSVHRYKTIVLNEFSNYFCWDKKEKEKREEELLKKMKEVISFK